MTRILSVLNVEYLDNSNRVFLAKPFGFISDTLIAHHLRQVGWNLRPAGHEDEFWAPAGFVFDFESVPNLIRGPLGENKRGGATHDPICRKNVLVYWPATLTTEELNDPKIQASLALITDPSPEGIAKSIAADVYFEIMQYCDAINTERFSQAKHPYLPMPVIVPYIKTRDWSRRWLKSSVVRVWPGYWQKYEMTATAKEIYGIEGDPYVTVEKLDVLIEQSKQATADIKDVQADQKTDLAGAIKESEQVTDALKNVKVEVKEDI